MTEDSKSNTWIHTLVHFQCNVLLEEPSHVVSKANLSLRLQAFNQCGHFDALHVE